MLALLRLLILVPVAYAAACLAGGALAAFLLFQHGAPDGPVLISFAVATGFLIAWGSGLLLVVPALIGAAAAEVAGWRSWMFWVPFGAFLALLLCLPGIGIVTGTLLGLGIIPPEQGLTLDGATRGEIVVAAAACGTVAGFVYWAIAGRHSGTGWQVTSSGSGPA
jgi:hypothetical protein